MFCLTIHPELRGPELYMLAFWDPLTTDAVFITKDRLFQGKHSHNDQILDQPLLYQTPRVPREIAAKLALRCAILEVNSIRDSRGRLLNIEKVPQNNEHNIFEEPNRKQVIFDERAVRNIKHL